MTEGRNPAQGIVHLSYSLIRNLTSPEEKENGVQTWFANVNARDITSIGTQDNLRTYIAEHKDSKRNRVHKEIESTIISSPDRFINRNSGVTITCTHCEIDDGARLAKMTNASIINGAQTQGEIKRYFHNNEDPADFNLRVEILMEPQHDQIVEVAIARNTATSVKSVSQANARGHLNDLASSIRAGVPGERLQQAETDEEGIPAQFVLQICRLLMPRDLEEGGTRALNMPYKQGGKCLADFSLWAESRKADPAAKERYDFTVSIAPTAIKLYRELESHESWNGHRLHEKGKRGGSAPEGGRPIKRREGKVDWVAPGLLFPVVAAMEAFVTKVGDNWTVDRPSVFDAKELIRMAVQQYRALERQVAYMGRGESAYEALRIYTETVAKVVKSAQ